MATKFWLGATTSFTTASNWSDSAAPQNGDTLIFTAASAGSCASDLASSLTGITLIIEPSFAHEIGAVDADTGAATPLRLFGGTILMPRTSGAGSPAYSPRVLLNLATVSGSPSVVAIEATSESPTESYYPPVQIIGTDIDARISGGIVGFAVRPGEVASITSLAVAKGDASPRVFIGRGATITSCAMAGGTVQNLSEQTIGTVAVADGVYVSSGSAAHSSIIVDGGTVRYNGSGAIGSLSCRRAFDASANLNPLTITDCELLAGYDANFDNGIQGGIVFTNPIEFPDGVGAGKLRTTRRVKATIEAL